MKTYLEVVTDALLANDLKQARYLLENEFSFNQIFSRMAVASAVKREYYLKKYQKSSKFKEFK